jgi:putative cell wall-binding protein
MRKILPFLLFAALLASAYAASLSSAQYIVVVGEGSTTADVVIAANFAASAKATLGVTFVSALDTEYAQLDDRSGKTIVIIMGKNVQVTGSGDAAVLAK